VGVLLALMLAAGLPPAAHAERASVETRLTLKLGAGTAAQVMRLVREAESRGLPTRPLIGRAFEGASRGASGARVVDAVRDHLHALRAADAALGDASETEVTAGSLAVLAGISPDSLAALRRARGGASLVVPLIVMSDLVARRVPADAASTTVIAAARGGVGDPDLMRMRERIDRELERGEAPARAASGQLQHMLRQIDERRARRASGGSP
jgi:hypothetical protein